MVALILRFVFSALTTAVISFTFPMPQCSYTIRKDEIDGEILKYARVGEQVVHRWECDSDIFGILVHSCYVEDGQGQRVYIVDEYGCHRDRYILGDPTYVEKLNLAYRESHVFKFADRLTVRFLCQIRLCVKFDDGCRGITPPICASAFESSAIQILGNGTISASNATLARSPSNTSSLLDNIKIRNILSRRHKRDSRSDGDHGFNLVDGDFFSQDLYVLDTTENPDRGSFNNSDLFKNLFLSSEPAKSGICFSLPVFVSFLTMISLIILSATLAGCCIVQRLKHSQKITERKC